MSRIAAHAMLASLYARAGRRGLLAIQLTILEIDCIDAWLASRGAGS